MTQELGRSRGSANLWASLAGLAGLALATWSALGAPTPFLAPHEAAVAWVNDVAITRAEYDRALEAIRADSRDNLTRTDRERALEILIREELLVQRANELGIIHADRAIRKAIVDSMMVSILTEQKAETPDEAVLRDFYDKAPTIWQKPEALEVRGVEIKGDGKATALAAALKSGTPFEKAAEDAGASPIPLPAGRVAPDKLRDYLGPSAVEGLKARAEGDIVGPLRRGDSFLFLWLLAREEGPQASYEEVRDILEKEWRRRQEAEAALAYFAQLRQAASITVAPEAFDE